jgi:hypothetical protein
VRVEPRGARTMRDAVLMARDGERDARKVEGKNRRPRCQIEKVVSFS